MVDCWPQIPSQRVRLWHRCVLRVRRLYIRWVGAVGPNFRNSPQDEWGWNVFDLSIVTSGVADQPLHPEMVWVRSLGLRLLPCWAFNWVSRVTRRLLAHAGPAVQHGDASDFGRRQDHAITRVLHMIISGIFSFGLRAFWAPKFWM